jgi:asparagine synthase (glutamine-hydrolysing)
MTPSWPISSLFLSGGIDSSVVAAERCQQSDDPVHIFAIHFAKRYPHELEYAASVAKRIGSTHEEVEIKTRDFVPRLRQMAWHPDDPIGDPVAIPNFALSRHVATMGFHDVLER